MTCGYSSIVCCAHVAHVSDIVCHASFVLGAETTDIAAGKFNLVTRCGSSYNGMQVKVPHAYDNMDFSDVYGTQASTTHAAALLKGNPPWSGSARLQRCNAACHSDGPTKLPAGSPCTDSTGVQSSIFSAAPTAAPNTDVPGHLGKWHLHPDSHMQRSQRHVDPLQPMYHVHGHNITLPRNVGQVQ